MTARGSRRVPPTALAIAAIFSVQFGNAWAAGLFDQAGPLGAAALRLIFSSLILIVIVRPRVHEWSRGTWVRAAALGVGLGGMNALIYLAFSEIPVGIAVTIELLGPLAVAASGSRRVIDGLWVLLALGGVLLLGFDGDGTVTIRGVAFALGAAACWALYIVASSKLGPRVRGVDGLAVAMVVAAAIVVPIGAPQAVTAIQTAPVLIALFVLVAVLTSVIPYGLEFVALKRIPARVFGVLSSLGPAVAAIAGLIVLGQVLTALHIAAIALVVSASIGVVASAERARP